MPSSKMETCLWRCLNIFLGNILVPMKYFKWKCCLPKIEWFNIFILIKGKIYWNYKIHIFNHDFNIKNYLTYLKLYILYNLSENQNYHCNHGLLFRLIGLMHICIIVFLQQIFPLNISQKPATIHSKEHALFLHFTKCCNIWALPT